MEVTSHTSSWWISSTPWPPGGNNTFSSTAVLGTMCRRGKTPITCSGLLKQHRLGKLFNARLPLILPEKLTLSSVTHADGRLRVTAVEKREYTERTPEHDEEKETESGERITLKAYMHHLTRTLAAFEWDLNANVAMLQITQLQEDGDYEKVAEQFISARQAMARHQAVRCSRSPSGDPQASRDREEWSGRGTFSRNRLSVAARQAGLGAQPEPAGLGARRSNSSMMRWIACGRTASATWATSTGWRTVSRGLRVNPLTGEVHVIIVGAKSRVNFPTPNTEDVVRYVLHRVRALS